MKKFAQILFRIFLVGLTVFLLISGIRWINWHRYKDQLAPNLETSSYQDPANLDNYQLDVPGLTIQPLSEGSLQGFHLLPDEKTKPGLIVTFGGSEGSPDFERATALAQAGYEVYALFFFGRPNQSETLAQVPLDFFEDFLKRVETDEPLTLIGSSKGAELVLNLASFYPDDIDHVVAFSPTSHRFFALDPQNMNQSSWTYRGKELFYLSQDHTAGGSLARMLASFLFLLPVNYGEIYQSILTHASQTELEAARIPIENYPGKLLLFAGGDDPMWPSQAMAEDLANYHSTAQLVTYPSAGHIFSYPGSLLGDSNALIAVGGHPSANIEAGQASHDLLLEKLAAWHGK